MRLFVVFVVFCRASGLDLRGLLHPTSEIDSTGQSLCIRSIQIVCYRVEVQNPAVLFCVLLFVVAGSMTCQETHAEDGAANQRRKLQDAPLDQLNEAVRAQAELIRAEAASRKIDAELSQALLDVEVDMKVFRAYWQKKSERKIAERKDVEQTLENRQLREVERRAALMAQWEVLFDPERMQIAKLRGVPQNLMLALLSERTEISYSSSLPSGVQLVGPGAFRLNDDVLNAIRVSSPTLNGKRIVFTLNDPVAIDLSWWPALLQQGDFADHRARVTEVREQLSQAARNQADLDGFVSKELEKGLAALTKAFFAKYPPGTRRGLSNRQLHLIFQAEDFLRQMDRDVTAVVLNGVASPIQGKPFNRQVDGEDVATLVRWMLRNNLRFEPPRPAEAGQYVGLFESMKGFCVACDIAPSVGWIEEASKDLDLDVH